ncbi:MAG: ammonium transporter [Planctomycetota bacterium]|nr:ammonium transporter [Planctomycetota bacterium]
MGFSLRGLAPTKRRAAAGLAVFLTLFALSTLVAGEEEAMTAPAAEAPMAAPVAKDTPAAAPMAAPMAEPMAKEAPAAKEAPTPAPAPPVMMEEKKPAAAAPAVSIPVATVEQTPAAAAPASVIVPLPDSTGLSYGVPGDIGGADHNKPTMDEVIVRVAQNKIAINFIWTLLCGFMVMFMQAGFALLVTGLCRAKNAGHTMAMNFMIYPLGMLGFYACGFGLMFGGAGAAGLLGGYPGLNKMFTVSIAGHEVGLFGQTGWFLGGHFDVAVYALFLLQMVFMNTTANIPTGAMAERWRFSAFMLYGCALGTILYPIYGCWVWGGGWCSRLGAWWGWGHGVVDFAGSSVVHLQGGVIALVGAWMLGPRIGKYNKDGSINAMPAHSIPLVMLGTFILAFCWFAFTAGSALPGSDLRIAVIAVNTVLASAAGAAASCLYMWLVRTGKPDPTMMANGMLAGLVAVSAPCAYIDSMSACIIGIVAGVLVVESVFFFDRVARIDDPVGVISVHGVNGIWGTLAVGLFADKSYGDGLNGVKGGVVGLFSGGGPGQLIAQAVGCAAAFVYVGLVSLIVFFLIDKLVGNRVGTFVELEGLDIPEMGSLGYNGIVLDKASETPISQGHEQPAAKAAAGKR